MTQGFGSGRFVFIYGPQHLFASLWKICLAWQLAAMKPSWLVHLGRIEYWEVFAAVAGLIPLLADEKPAHDGGDVGLRIDEHTERRPCGEGRTCEFNLPRLQIHPPSAALCFSSNDASIFSLTYLLSSFSAVLPGFRGQFVGAVCHAARQVVRWLWCGCVVAMLLFRCVREFALEYPYAMQKYTRLRVVVRFLKFE